MSSVETSDGGSMRVLGLIAYSTANNALIDVAFRGRGLQALSAQVYTPIGAKAYVRILCEYDGPAGVDPQTEFVATLGTGDIPGQHDTYANVVAISDTQFAIDSYANDGQVVPELVHAVINVAVWAVGGAVVPGTITVPPPP